MPSQSIFGGAEGGNTGPAPSNVPIPVPQQSRAQNLYPLDNPQMAMMAVLKSMGYNPFQTNPFTAQMLKAAPGLAALWQLSNIGAKAGDITANGGPEQMFGDFLRNQLQTGNTFNSLSGGLANANNYMGQMTDLSNRLGSNTGGVDVSQLPAFLGGLENQLNSPSGFAQIFGAMAAPGLGGLAPSYNRSLEAASTGANVNYINSPSFGQPQGGSFLDFILGRRH